MFHPKPDPISPGQESVWDYPRPPRIESSPAHCLVVLNGVTVADSRNTIRFLETSHPPTYYFPPEDVDGTLLLQVDGTSYCEWKGSAVYHDLVVGDVRSHRAAWSYPDPVSKFAALKNHVAFFAQRVDSCHVDGHQVQPQPGEFYGGWITPHVVGPFKGQPGTMHW